MENRIIQVGNYNANAELFIYNKTVIKIYNGDDNHNTFNINVIKNIFSKLSVLSSISELVLPKNLIVYNDNIVGFSMPYINGITLEKTVNKNLYSDQEIKKIFLRLLNIINRCHNLPFHFYIGDMHEKNIMIDKNNKIYIIDPDSFIINDNKLSIDGKYLIGKYTNHFYNNSEIEKIQSSADHFSLLCMILNYAFKNIIEDTSEPVTWLKSDLQFKEIYPILNRVNENFILSEEDINKIFDFKNKLEYKPKDNKELLREIRRVRTIAKKVIIYHNNYFFIYIQLISTINT